MTRQDGRESLRPCPDRVSAWTCLIKMPSGEMDRPSTFGWIVLVGFDLENENKLEDLP